MYKSLAPESAYREWGIVLHTLRYSENKLIVHLLTKNRGRTNYITTMSSKVKKNIFQPMTILDFQAISTKSELNRISQAEIGKPLHNISMDLSKCTLAMFISELLYRIVREPLDDQNMYSFVESSIISLNYMERGVGNFHIWFLVHFAYYMGYQFPAEYTSGEWLDIKTGLYTHFTPVHSLRIAPQYAVLLDQFTHTTLDHIYELELSRSTRGALLRALVDYFSYHCDTFNSVKSIDILSQVF